MASFNRVILLGNVTRDLELRYIPSGMAVTDLGLAVNHRYKNANGDWVEEATFVDVTLWGRTAEVACEYLSKGSPVLIEGRLKLDTWEKEGQKFSKLRVVGERMQLLGGRGDGSQGGPPRGSSRSARAPQAAAAFASGPADAGDYGVPEYSPPAGRGDDFDRGGDGGSPNDIPF